MVAVLGQDTVKLKFASQPPTVVLMAGLQGRARPTSGQAGQLAEESGRQPPLVSVDVYRPAARQQLK
jgi:signal recognition particle subunit SRP54